MLFSEYLIEKITIDNVVHDKLHSAVDKWLSSVKSTLPEGTYQDEIDWIRDNNREVEQKIANQKAWKRFNKKIIEKLTPYLNNI